ncbi:MAG: FAD binding domain-containing protein [Treponema sp.]
MSNNYTVYTAKSLSDLYTIMQRNPHITPLAGTTGLLKGYRGDKLALPESIVLLKNIPELHTIIKRERFIDFGSAASLNAILDLGNKNIPDILYQALVCAANPGIRSLATIGGNIANASIKSSCLIPLLALDAKVEIRTQKETFWKPLMRYCDEDSRRLRDTPHIILRIRVPSEEWNISYYKRLGPIGHIAADTASFVFLARIQKNMISDVKMLFGSTHIIKKKEFENLFKGNTFPLDRRTIAAKMKETEDIFADTVFISDFQKSCFFNLIEKSLYLLGQ